MEFPEFCRIYYKKYGLIFSVHSVVKNYCYDDDGHSYLFTDSSVTAAALTCEIYCQEL